MNLRIVVFLLFAAVAAMAEEPVPALTLFAIPKVELKAAVQTNEVVAVNEKTDEAEEFSVSKEVVTVVSESSISSWEAMNGSPVLSAPTPTYELGGAIGWLDEKVLKPVFEPEVVKVGKVYVTGGIVTAVKRKNPFCLLNPLVFYMAW